MQRRFTPGRLAQLETREDGQQVVVGYAAVFYREGDPGTEYRLWGNLIERIAPEAFNRALAEKQDVRGLFNHEPDNLLGRTGPGTLRLSADDLGLRYEVDLPDTQVGRDLAVSLARGDLTGSSFSFLPKHVQWQEEEENSDIRTLTDVDLYDVGPVTFPAYEATSAGLRAAGEAEEIEKSRAEWKARRGEDEAIHQREAIAVRAKLAGGL